MHNFFLATVVASAILTSDVAAQELRIGFLNTTTGGGALIGKHMENGWKLGLEHAGWTKDGDRLGGIATRIFYADDQSKPDIGIKEVDKFLKQDKVQVVAGIIWMNVLMAVQKPIFEANAMLLGTNAGPASLAGEQCNPLYVSSSFVSDSNAEATGEMANKDGIESVVALAPNYQAGKEIIAGFERTYKAGKIVDLILFKLGETDFQADLAKIRAAKPKGVFVFAPGAMGVAFMKQWATSGLDKEIKLYTVYTIDYVTLPAIGAAGLGATESSHWNPDLANPRNGRFIKDYVAKFGHTPSYFALQSYDAPELIAKAMRAVGGKLDDMNAVARVIRKDTLDSPRGSLRYNHNGFVIQPYWRLTVERGPDGKPLIKGGEKIMERPDAHGERCPAHKRT